MRGSKAKRLRRELTEDPTPKPNIREKPGPNRAERRMEKFKPGRYADLEHQQSPRARITQIKRWIYIYSPLSRMKPASTQQEERTTP